MAQPKWLNEVGTLLSIAELYTISLTGMSLNRAAGVTRWLMAYCVNTNLLNVLVTILLPFHIDHYLKRSDPISRLVAIVIAVTVSPLLTACRCSPIQQKIKLLFLVSSAIVR